MHILVTNDDGIFAPGLLALAQALRPLGQVSILAPDHNWSGCGHVKTLDRPLRVREVTLADGSPALTSDGAPSDCVALALLGIFPDKVDLVVSGINSAPNLGHDVTYSGTVTAAMEAVIWDTPAVAVSLDARSRPPVGGVDYAPSANIARQVAEVVLTHGLPPGMLLNVNVPDLPVEAIIGMQITRQGTRVYRDRLDQRVDPRGQAYYWIGGDTPIGIPERGTDIGALSSGYVSITPLHLDLTAYWGQQVLATWDWPLGNQGVQVETPASYPFPPARLAPQKA